jgi:hypothetical protein
MHYYARLSRFVLFVTAGRMVEAPVVFPGDAGETAGYETSKNSCLSKEKRRRVFPAAGRVRT